MRTAEIAACMLPVEELNRRKKVELKEVFEGALQIKELENGYELQFPSDEVWFDKLTSLIAVERLCCPFLHFELIVLPKHAPVSLRVLGSMEAKEFVKGLISEAADR